MDPELERTVREAYTAFAEGDFELLRDFWPRKPPGWNGSTEGRPHAKVTFDALMSAVRRFVVLYGDQLAQLRPDGGRVASCPCAPGNPFSATNCSGARVRRAGRPPA